jgi:hypothetical protein
MDQKDMVSARQSPVSGLAVIQEPIISGWSVSPLLPFAYCDSW